MSRNDYSEISNTPDLSLKQVDAAIPLQSIPNSVTTSGISWVNLIAEGAAQYQRVGNGIAMHSMDLSVGLTPGAADGDIHCRIILVYGRQADSGGVPQFNDIFGSVASDGTTYLNIFSGLKDSWKQRALILFDDFLTLPRTGVAGAMTLAGVSPDERALCFKKRINLHGLLTKYSAATAVPSSVSTGRLVLYALVDSGAAGTWKIFGDCRLYYTDRV